MSAFAPLLGDKRTSGRNGGKCARRAVPDPESGGRPPAKALSSPCHGEALVSQPQESENRLVAAAAGAACRNEGPATVDRGRTRRYGPRAAAATQWGVAKW